MQLTADNIRAMSRKRTVKDGVSGGPDTIEVRGLHLIAAASSVLETT
jgi:hypothetical protein